MYFKWKTSPWLCGCLSKFNINIVNIIHGGQSDTFTKDDMFTKDLSKQICTTKPYEVKHKIVYISGITWAFSKCTRLPLSSFTNTISPAVLWFGIYTCSSSHLCSLSACNWTITPTCPDCKSPINWNNANIYYKHSFVSIPSDNKICSLSSKGKEVRYFSKSFWIDPWQESGAKLYDILKT